MSLTDKQIENLKNVQSTDSVSIKASVALKALSLINTHGGAGRPGYLKTSLTDAGKQASGRRVTLRRSGSRPRAGRHPERQKGQTMTPDTDTLKRLADQITPGPWKLSGEATVVMDDGGVEPWICEVNFEGTSDEQARADASLIALAPALLREVLDLRAEVEALRGAAV